MRPDKVDKLQTDILDKVTYIFAKGLKKLQEINLNQILDINNFRLSESYCRPDLPFKGITVITEFPDQQLTQEIL